MFAERREGRIGDGEIDGHLARGLEHEPRRLVEATRPALSLVDHGADVRVGDAELAGDLDMVRVLVGRAREIADLKDRQLAQARIEPTLMPNELAEADESPRALRAVYEGAMEGDLAREKVLVAGSEISLAEIGYAGHGRNPLSLRIGCSGRPDQRGAAVHDQGLARDVARVIGEQEPHRMPDVPAG